MAVVVAEEAFTAAVFGLAAFKAALFGLEAFIEVVPFMPVGAIESQVGPVTDTDTVDMDMVRQRWWGALPSMGRITIAASTMRTGSISVPSNILTIGIDPR